MIVRTQVGIVGAGPAGLVLSHLLHLQGIESVIVESRSREAIESTVRAGVLEHGTVQLMTELGLDLRMRREGAEHHGIHLRFAGETHRLSFTEHADGRSIMLYPQHEFIKDLVAARLAGGGQIRFEAGALGLAEAGADRPRIRFTQGGAEHELHCDFVAGCDGFYSVVRPAMPVPPRQELVHVHPLGWFGILVEAPRSSDELIYACHREGFALVSTRSPTLQRMYFQCDPKDDVKDWSDDRIWERLHRLLETRDGWKPKTGPIVAKSIVGMRSFVAEPMQHGRLFIAGDAAHIVPPTGAKGLNLAVADVKLLAQGFDDYYRTGRTTTLDGYSAAALRRVWRAEHFSWWMTSMLHRFPDTGEFQHRRQLAQLASICSSPAAARTLAENYVGFPLP